MPDFNLEQFKAGRIAIDRYGNHYRFLALIKNEFSPLVVAKIIYLGQELPYPCSIEGKIDDDDILKMKPEKKKIYIAVTKKLSRRNRYFCTDGCLSKEDALESCNEIVNDSCLPDEKEAFKTPEIVEVEIDV